MNAIVAVYSDWGIGARGTQPVVLRADRAHFAALTRGATVIVGRRTMEDFPGGRPLKGRDNIVLTRSLQELEGARTASSPEEAAAMAGDGDNVFVLGGQSVFLQMLPHVRRVYVTRIELRPESDSFFPDLDRSGEWSVTELSEPMEENGVVYSFRTYERA